MEPISQQKRGSICIVRLDVITEEILITKRSVFDLFTKSPFGAIQSHMKKAIECAQQLEPLFYAAFAGNKDEIQRITNLINQLENEADQIKNEIRNHLPKSILLSVDRRDLLDLIHTQDSIADSVQETAGLLTLKKLSFPTKLQPEALDLIREILVTCDLAATISNEMDELAESTFGGPEAKKVLVMIDQLDDVETKSDVIGITLARRIFAMEDQMTPVDVMLWYRIFYMAGQVANNAERMGNRVRLLIAQV